MKNTKKLLAFLMAFALITCVACSQSTSTSESPGSSKSTTAAQTKSSESSVAESSKEETKAAAEDGPLAPYPEMITITTARDASSVNAFRPGDDWSHNHYYDNYRTQLNIDVVNEYEISGGGGYDAKINVLIASGDLPDFFRVSPLQLAQLNAAGSVLDLADVYRTYASDLLRAEMESVDTILPSVTYDGKMIGVPQTSIVAQGMMWIRGDWREKVGIQPDEIKTLEGFMTLVKAFMTEDPDGNGEDDTFGLTGLLLAGAYGQNWVFNAFHAYPRIWYERDGKAVYGSVQPEVRDALVYLTQLYEEGVLDPNFAAMEALQVQDAFNAHKLGVYDDKQWGSTVFGGIRATEPDATLEYYEYPSSDDSPALAQTSLPVTGIYVVNKDCQYPEAVIKLANFYLEKTWNLKDADEMSYYVSEDYEGVYYHHRTSAAIIPAVPLEHYKVGLECAGYWDGTLALEDTTVYTQSCIAYCFDPNQWYMDVLFGKNGAITRLTPDIMDNNRYVADMYNLVPTATMETKWTVLTDKEEEVFLRIVMGQDSIDAFDTFVEEWHALGGDDITQEMNARF